ncbi:unnamed protein product [Rhodiola kirilowii]
MRLHRVDRLDQPVDRLGNSFISQIFSISRRTGKTSSRQSTDWSYSTGNPNVGYI